VGEDPSVTFQNNNANTIGAGVGLL
jgi:hypothetical protein